MAGQHAFSQHDTPTRHGLQVSQLRIPFSSARPDSTDEMEPPSTPTRKRWVSAWVLLVTAIAISGTYTLAGILQDTRPVPARSQVQNLQYAQQLPMGNPQDYEYESKEQHVIGAGAARRQAAEQRQQQQEQHATEAGAASTERTSLASSTAATLLAARRPASEHRQHQQQQQQQHEQVLDQHTFFTNEGREQVLDQHTLRGKQQVLNQYTTKAKEQVLLEQYTDLYEAAAGMGPCVLEYVMRAIQTHSEPIQHWERQCQRLQRRLESGQEQMAYRFRRLASFPAEGRATQQHADDKGLPQRSTYGTYGTSGLSGARAVPAKPEKESIGTVMDLEQAYASARTEGRREVTKAMQAALAQLLKELSYDATCGGRPEVRASLENMAGA